MAPLIFIQETIPFAAVNFTYCANVTSGILFILLKRFQSVVD